MTVRASVPRLDGGTAPLPDLELIALPYDRDSVLATLEAKASPRPHTRELDSLFALWRDPFVRFAAATGRSHQLRDSLASLKQQLDSLPRNSADYTARYQSFGRLTDTLAAVTDSGEKARLQLDRLRKTVLPAIDSLRRIVTEWENSTFREYEDIVRRLGERRAPIAARTGPAGQATITLGPGDWWIYAWAWDEGDPYSRWYWNVPVRGDDVVLDGTTGRKRPQY